MFITCTDLNQIAGAYKNIAKKVNDKLPKNLICNSSQVFFGTYVEDYRKN